MIDPASTHGRLFVKMLAELGRRRSRYDRLEDYLEDRAGIPVHADRACAEAYQRLMSIARTNYADLVVESTRERMQVQGFRTGRDDDPNGDSLAWDIWQANSLDADQSIVHRTFIGLADSYAMVGDVDPELGVPLITPEDPREVITLHDPVRRRRMTAALKVWHDDGVDRARLFTPGWVTPLSRPAADDTLAPTPDGWVAGEPQRLRTNRVPVVKFANRAGGRWESHGEFEHHIGILDRINYMKLQQLEIATMQAFRQRAVKGLDDVDENGDEIDYSGMFSASPGALWQLPDTAELWESGQVDLGPLRQAGRDDVMDLAAVTRTPLYYLTPDAADGSAEGASLAREGLVFRTTDHLRQAGEGWEETISLAFDVLGVPQAARHDMEVLWAAPDRWSLAERADAASKAEAGGMTWREIQSSIWGKTPQEIARMEAERVESSLAAVLSGTS